MYFLRYLGPAELFCCRLVCKFWNQLLENESDRLWKRFCSPNWIISSSKNENNKYERLFSSFQVSTFLIDHLFLIIMMYFYPKT